MSQKLNRQALLTPSEIKYIREIGKFSANKYASNDEIIKHIVGYRTNTSARSFEFILRQVSKLIIYSARTYKNVSVDIGDLIHCGVEAVHTAIQYYNIAGKVKFITYFKTVLDNRLSEYMDESQQAVKMGKHILSRVGQIKGGIIKPEEGETVYSKVHLESVYNPAYRNMFFRPEYIIDPESRIDYESLQYDIMRIMDSLLDDREKDVLILLFGLDGNPPKKLESISVLMGGTPQLMGYIRDKALSKVRSNDKAKVLLNKYR